MPAPREGGGWEGEQQGGRIDFLAARIVAGEVDRGTDPNSCLTT